MKQLPLLTVICPVFNEEAAIPIFVDRLQKVFSSLESEFRYNLLFVDNCSQDKTKETIIKHEETHPWIYHISLSRNFGYQCSVECGLTNAQGDLFMVIDVDCEDPPELIDTFLGHWREGYDIVYGERIDRPESAWLKSFRKLFYRLTHSIADDYFVLDMAEFALITAEVRDAVRSDNNSYPFIRSSIGRVGFKRKNVPYKREPRVAGKTHYNLRRMTIYAIAGILSSSTFPLRLPAYCLPIWTLLMAAVTIAGFTGGPSWHLPCILALAFLGFTFCGITVVFVGIYLARVYKNGLQRPNVIIRNEISKVQTDEDEMGGNG